MELTRLPLPWDATTDDATLVCQHLDPGRWLVERGYEPPAAHLPATMLDDGALQEGVPGQGMALSLSSAAAIRLSLGPALVDRLSHHGVRVGPLAGLALHELIANAIIHGNLAVASGRSEIWHDLSARQMALTAALTDPRLAERLITVVLGWGGQRAVAVVADQGDGYDATPPPAPECTPKRGSGRGLKIARAVGDIEVRFGGRQTRLTLDCALTAPSGRQ